MRTWALVGALAAATLASRAAAQTPTACNSAQLHALAAQPSFESLATTCDVIATRTRRLPDRTVVAVEPALFPGLASGAAGVPVEAAAFFRFCAEADIATLCRLADRRDAEITRFTAAWDGALDDLQADDEAVERVSAHYTDVDLAHACPTARAAVTPACAAVAALRDYRAHPASRPPPAALLDAGLPPREGEAPRNQLAPERIEVPPVVGSAVSEVDAFLSVAVQAIADFLRQRMQAELQTFVFDKIRTELCSAAVGTIVPATCAFLSDAHSLFSPSAGSGFRNAVVSDVLHMPRSLRAYVDSDGSPVPNDAVGGLLVRLVLDVAVAVTDSATPDELFDAFERSVGRMQCGPADCTALASGTTRAIAVARTASILRARLDDDAFLALRAKPRYLGWLVLAATGAPASETSAFIAVLDAWFDLTHALAETPSADPDPDPGAEPSLSSAAVPARATAHVAHALLGLARTVLAAADPSADLHWLAYVSDFVDAAIAGDMGRILTAALTLARQALALADAGATTPHALPSIVARVLTLGVELASAPTREEAAHALDAFAAPVGSWRAKSQHPMVSLTGFVGISGGGEWLAGGGARNTVGGLVAPVGMVGLDVTTPIADTWSFGLFVSVLDLGGLVGMPWATPTGYSTEIHPAQFLAPGLWLRFGVPGVPLAILAGGEIMPFGTVLIEDATMKHFDTPALRLGLSLAVDVTIFPF